MKMKMNKTKTTQCDFQWSVIKQYIKLFICVEVCVKCKRVYIAHHSALQS